MSTIYYTANATGFEHLGLPHVVKQLQELPKGSFVLSTPARFATEPEALAECERLRAARDRPATGPVTTWYAKVDKLAHELATATAQMRAAQKDFFKHRDDMGKLALAKNTERFVDKLLEDYQRALKDGPDPSKQIPLVPDEKAPEP